MNLQDATKNQHFVPQIEQRFNAINPLAKEENQNIYSFSLNDRESYSISLDSEKGFKIANTLSLNDVTALQHWGQTTINYCFLGVLIYFLCSGNTPNMAFKEKHDATYR